MKLHIGNGKGIEVANVADAVVQFEAFVAKKAAKGQFLSSRSYIPSPVVADGEVVGYISMNGKFWTRETGHGTTPDKLNFDLMTQRYWHKHL